MFLELAERKREHSYFDVAFFQRIPELLAGWRVLDAALKLQSEFLSIRMPRLQRDNMTRGALECALNFSEVNMHIGIGRSCNAAITRDFEGSCIRSPGIPVCFEIRSV